MSKSFLNVTKCNVMDDYSLAKLLFFIVANIRQSALPFCFAVYPVSLKQAFTNKTVAAGPIKNAFPPKPTGTLPHPLTA